MILKTCSRCGRQYGEIQVRRCPNETVNQVYGENICYYCCKRCKYHTTVPDCGGIGCGYKNITKEEKPL